MIPMIPMITYRSASYIGHAMCTKDMFHTDTTPPQPNLFEAPMILL